MARASAILLCFDSIAMPVADQADDISRPVHNDRKQVGDVTAEHAHVEGRDIGERGELTSKRDAITILTKKDDLCLHAINH